MVVSVLGSGPVRFCFLLRSDETQFWLEKLRVFDFSVFRCFCLNFDFIGGFFLHMVIL